MTSSFKDDITGRIAVALRENEQTLKKGIQTYQREVDGCVRTTEAAMNGVSKKMQQHLNEYSEKQRQFFSFDGARSVVFWLGCLTNIASLILLVYFLFVR